MIKDNITGIILAGGKSSRMGTDKSLLLWKGKTLIEHSIETIKPLCSKIIISSNNPVYDFTGCETWLDELPFQAPIIGIYSCLKRSETSINIVLSCDLPLIGSEIFNYMYQYIENTDMVIPSFNGNIEPLCGFYNQSAIFKLSQFIEHNNFRLYECIKTCKSNIIMISNELNFYNENMFSNINSPDEYQKLLTN